jgi:hypothetical protein
MSRSALVAFAVLAAGILPRAAEAQPPAQSAEAQPAEVQPARPSAGDLRGQVAAIRKDVDQLKASAAQSQTLSGSVQALSARVTALSQQVERVSRQRAAGGDVAVTLDRLSAQTATLERDVESLRTQVAGIEQPGAGPGGSAGSAGLEYKRGFEWTTGDGAYSIKIGGFFQPRYQATVAEGADSVDEATFRLRRARLAVGGQAGEQLDYKVQLEVSGGGSPALDYFLDYEIAPELSVRVGQDKLYYTRVWWASDASIDIFERPSGVEGVRYDRDIGIWAHGWLLDERIYYHAGASNGAGPNETNDNIDLVSLVRVDATLLGARFDAFSANLTLDPELRVMAGAGATHDLVQLPAQVAGTAVGSRDVDGDGDTDNVRVWSTSADLALRWYGLELIVEGLWRHERWGSILDHTDNAPLAIAIDADSQGHRNYLAGYVHASYPIIPDLVQLAARFGHSRIALLGVGGRSIDSPPRGDRLVEATAQVRLFVSGNLSMGGAYSYLDHNTRVGPEQAGDIEHFFIAQAQLNF